MFDDARGTPVRPHIDDTMENVLPDEAKFQEYSISTKGNR
jgi:hypothetical protein